MFVNISRHPSRIWPQEQIEAALEISPDGIVDVAFPFIPPTASEEEVEITARRLASSIGRGVTAAMVQGEYTLTVYLSNLLGLQGIDVYVAALGPQYEQNGKRLRPFIRFRRIVEGVKSEYVITNSGGKSDKQSINDVSGSI